MDTGARTSALHAFELEAFKRDLREWVRFSIHPLQGASDRVIQCEMPILERREVTDSGGHQENRPVIETDILLGGICKKIELTLTGRDTMRFRMLLGRTAIATKFTCIIHPNPSNSAGLQSSHRSLCENRGPF